MSDKCDVDCRLCTTLIEVCARRGDTDRALQMYRHMRQAPADSKLAPTVHAYTAAMRAAAEGGLWEDALTIWQDMEKGGCKPTGASGVRREKEMGKAGSGIAVRQPRRCGPCQTKGQLQDRPAQAQAGTLLQPIAVGGPTTRLRPCRPRLRRRD